MDFILQMWLPYCLYVCLSLDVRSVVKSGGLCFVEDAFIDTTHSDIQSTAPVPPNAALQVCKLVFVVFPFFVFFFFYVCLQCFDTVGWAAGRASGL